MIDIHSHILFDVDDGAKTIEDSIEIIKEAVKQGIDKIILTPHFEKKHLDKQKIISNYELLKKEAQKQGLEAKLYLGNEIYLASDNLELIEEKAFFTLADSHYILVEFDDQNIPDNIADICYEIKLLGFIPIIAHTERYINLYQDKSLLEDIIEEGALFQVNASSIIKEESGGSHTTSKFAHFLLKNKLASFVASDAHDIDYRGVHMLEAYNKTKQLCGQKYTDEIFTHNQQKIIDNIAIEYPRYQLQKSILLGLINHIFGNKKQIFNK